jgi:hypothetical protein
LTRLARNGKDVATSTTIAPTDISRGVDATVRYWHDRTWVTDMFGRAGYFVRGMFAG